MKMGFISNMNLIKIDHHIYIYYYIYRYVCQVDDRFILLLKVTAKGLFILKHLKEILY